MLKIGVNPIVWSNDDLPELGGNIPLEQCLKEAQAAGYQGIELGNKFPRDSDQLTQALTPYDLACVSGWYSTFLLERSVDEELASARAHLELLQAQGCSVLIVAEMTRGVHPDVLAPLSTRPAIDDDQWEILGARLSDFARRVKNRGLQVAYHHHMGTVVQSQADIERLMLATADDVGLLLDTGHAAFAKADPAALAERFGNRVVHVHAKDVRQQVALDADRHDWSFLQAVKEGVFTVPGDGVVDFRAVFRALAECGYGEGWVVVEAEQDPQKAPPAQYAKVGHDAVTALLDQAGLVKKPAR